MFNKKNILFIIQILLVLILVFCLYKIGVWLFDNQKTQNTLEKIDEYIEIVEDEDVAIKIDFESLVNLNEDTIGYLKVNNTNIEYPVVQSEDNDYYLYRSFDKSYNEAGWPFLDYKNKLDGTDKNIIIYGHNRLDNSMFGDLEEALSESWYSNEENRIIIFVTEDGYYEYEIFSIYTTLNEEYYIETEFYNEEFVNFIEVIKNRSINDFGVEVLETDQILTLSTCYANDVERMVVHAKLLKNKVM